MWKYVAAVLGVALVAFVAFTWWALEWDGVMVVETASANGATRSTHVWYVERDGQLWLEAGTPENGWFVDARAASRLRVAAPARLAGEYALEIVPGAEGHRTIRALLREQYGLRDWWVNVLVDTSRSLAVRLVPPPGRDAP